MPDQIAPSPQPAVSILIDAPLAAPSPLASPAAGMAAAPAPATGPTPLVVSATAVPVDPAKPEESVKRAFPAPAEIPTLQGPAGVRFDFNDGCRVVLDEAKEPWRIRLSDIDTGNVLFETQLKSGRVNSSKRYFVRFRVEIGQKDNDRVFFHEYSAADQEVLIQLPVGTLGDTLGWFPYTVKFQELHKCKLTVAMAQWLIPLFRDAHPNITFVTHEEVKPERYYATYNIGLFFEDKDNFLQPTDFRLVGLHRTAGYILGVDPTEVPPRLAITDETRPIAEKYVCIAAQSTTQSKYWNNPEGWREIVAFLKQSGYRVICIDQKATHGVGIVWNHIPYGAEDQTGDRPLLERVRWLRHADFFVGLSSGLSWLAWAAGTPTVMISGFSHPTNEFTTPYRVVNFHTCNSCWNDPQHRFDHKDYLWCPRHKDTPRQFECTRLITSEQVKKAIQRIPGFPAKVDASSIG